MRADTKQYFDMDEALEAKIAERGYRCITPSDQNLFSPYYDAMNSHWCANTSFLTFIGWKAAIRPYFKVEGELILVLTYVRDVEALIACPCIGAYTEEKIRHACEVLHEDFAAFGRPFTLADIVPWMLPYYQDNPYHFAVEDLRSNMDYVFTPEEFVAGMEMQDDRYRYRYFKRKYNYETVELSPEHLEECKAFMNLHWCEDKPCDTCMCGCLADVVANIVADFDKLWAYGILVRVDGEMAGLSIVTCRNGLGVYQYKNAINRIKGINEYLLRESFNRYMTGAHIIDYTEDMGVESLRYYKSHMAPSYSLLSVMTLREEG